MTTTELIALIAFLTPLCVSLAGLLYKIAEARLPHNKAVLLAALAQIAVQAAEQVASSNEEKKARASAIVVSGLASLGIKVAPVLIDAAIESLVYTLKNQPARGEGDPVPSVGSSPEPVPLVLPESKKVEHP